MMGRSNGGSGRAGAIALAAAFAAMALMPHAALAENLLDVLSATYQYSPRLDAERARLRATDEDIARATSDYRPTISLNADVGRTNTNSRPNFNGNNGATTPRGYSVQLIQPLFRGFRTTNAVNKAESDVRAGREELRNVEQEVLITAVQAYGDVVRDQALVRLNENNVQFLSEQLKATEDRFAVGEVTKTDVAQSKARRAQAVSDLDFARANLKSSQAVFEQNVGRPPSRLAEPNWRISLLPHSLDEALGIAVQENPVVVQALYREQSARFAVDQIRGELLPEAQLEATYSDRFDGSRSIEETETASVVGRLSVPIYTNGSVEARVRAQKHTHVSFIQEIEQNRALARAQVSQAWAQLQGAKAQYESDKAQIESNRIALDGVREEEKVGQRTVLEILNARQELLQSEAQLERTKRNLLVFTYQVVQAVGRLSVAELGAVTAVYDPEVHTDEVRRKWYGLDITHDDGSVEHIDTWNAHVDRAPMK